MTNEMITRVAIALYEAQYGSGWERCHDSVQKPYLEQARAALLAMRQPTNDMYVAGIEANPERAGSSILTAKWQAMIDAALKEDTKP